MRQTRTHDLPSGRHQEPIRPNLTCVARKAAPYPCPELKPKERSLADPIVFFLLRLAIAGAVVLGAAALLVLLVRLAFS